MLIPRLTLKHYLPISLTLGGLWLTSLWPGAAPEAATQSLHSQCRIAAGFDERGQWTQIGVISREAIDLCREAVAADPDDPNLWAYLGRSLFVNGLLEESIRWIRPSAERTVIGQALLGVSYETGSGVDKNAKTAAAWYRKAALQGQSNAQVNLGLLYAKGEGVAKDDAEAQRWYRMAAQGGNVDGMFLLGQVLVEGRGTIKDIAAALTWYELAARGGHADARNSLGAMYFDGKGVARDYKFANQWFQLSASQGNVYAQYNLGIQFEYGYGVTRDLMLAALWYRKSAEGGSAQAQLKLGGLYETGTGVEQDLAKAKYWYEQAVKGNIAAAQYALGELYYSGRGVTQDYAAALEYYRLAARQDHAGSEFSIGWMLHHGQGVTRDVAGAMQWYEKAAEAGYIDARVQLARIYEDGDGLPQDLDRAARHYEIAVEAGSNEARVRLGALFEQGRGRAWDPAQAERLYRAAAQAEHAQAQFNLGRLYLNGIGVNADLDEAKRWLSKAKENGSKAAQELLRLIASVEAPKTDTEEDEDSPLETEIAALALRGNMGSVARLSQIAQSTGGAARAFALEALGEIRAPASTDFLLEFLSDPDEQVRAAAAKALGRIGSRKALSVLIGIVNDRSAGVRAAALSAMSRIRGTPVPAIAVTALKDPVESVRVEALRVLLANAENQFVQPIVKLLDQTASDLEAIMCLRVLAEIATPDAVHAIQLYAEAAITPEKSIGAYYYYIIARPSEGLSAMKSSRFVSGLTTEEDRSTAALFVTLALFGARRPLGQSLVDSLPVSTDKKFLNLLLLVDKLPRADFLGSSMDHGLMEASDFGESESSLRVFRVFMDTMPQIFSLGQQLGLGPSSDPNELAKMIDALLADFPRAQKMPTVTQLGELREVKAVPSLIALLRTSTGELKLAVINALGKIGTMSAQAALRSVIESFAETDEARSAAAGALGRSMNLRDIPAELVRGYPLMLWESVAYVDEPPASLVMELIDRVEQGNTVTGLMSLLKGIELLDVRKVSGDPAHLENITGPRPKMLSKSARALLARWRLDARNDPRVALAAATEALADGRLPLPSMTIALRWRRAEAYLAMGDASTAIQEIATIESDLIPNLTRAERELSGLAFEGYTRYPKARATVQQGRFQEAARELDTATALLEEDMRYSQASAEAPLLQRVRAAILATSASVGTTIAKQQADTSLELFKRFDTVRPTEEAANELALNVRVKHAIGDGDYELAQSLIEEVGVKRMTRRNDLNQLAITDPGRAQVMREYTVLRQRVAELDRSRSDALRAPASGTEVTGQLVVINRERQIALQRLKDFEVRLKQTHPEVRLMVGGLPTEIRDLQPLLRKDQVLLQYGLLDEVGYAFIMTREGLDVIDLPFGARTLGPMVDAYVQQTQGRRACTPSESRGEFPATDHSTCVPTTDPTVSGKVLAEILLRPIATKITGYARLTLVPSGPLHRLPFTALPYGDLPLGHRFIVNQLATSSVLSMTARDKNRTGEFLAVAVPHRANFEDIPYAEMDVHAIARRFPRTAVRIGPDATVGAIRAERLRGRAVHFGTHAIAGDPDETRLILFDADLTLRDVWGLDLEGSPLVVLSACRTSLGRRLAGDEVASLANGFVFAGARSVVATL